MSLLGFDYFALLDHLTIARSRRHIEKYYGTSETGRFPNRLPPINIKPDLDRLEQLRSIAEINHEIRRLNLAAYAPCATSCPINRVLMTSNMALRYEVVAVFSVNLTAKKA